MDQKRRLILEFGALVGLMASVGLIAPAQAEEWSRAPFAEKSLDSAIRVLGAEKTDPASVITFTAPEIAENGAVVPVVVSTSVKAEQIAILVENNPNPLAAQFFLSARTEPFVAARIKMAETSRVYALAKVEGQWVMASKEIKVTIGGCGG